MDDLLFTSLFAVFGMTSVFLVLMMLTAVMLLMGAIRKRISKSYSTRPMDGDQQSCSTPPLPEHVAVIAAAIARYGGASADEIRMTEDNRRQAWSTGLLASQPMGRIQVLRRTR